MSADLGLAWRIVVERNGKPAAAITRDWDGLRMSFFADDAR